MTNEWEDFLPEPEDDGGTMSAGFDWDAHAEAELAIEKEAAREEQEQFKSPDYAGQLAQWPFNAIAKLNHYTVARMRAHKRGPVEAIPTPFPTANRACLYSGGRVGIARGWHTIIGGASNRGKSTVALNFVASAIRNGETVLYLALEADIEDIGTRASSVVSGVPLDRLTRGHDYDFEADKEACAVLLDQPGRLLINRVPIYKTADLESTIKVFARSFGVTMFVVDHIQLASTGDERGLAAQSAEVSNMMNSLAKGERMVSLGLSQLTTGAARDLDHAPTMYHLMGGIPLVSDADLIWIVDHSRASWQTNVKERYTDTVLDFGKNRHGPALTFKIRFDWTTNRVSELVDLPALPAPQEPAQREREVQTHLPYADD